MIWLASDGKAVNATMPAAAMLHSNTQGRELKKSIISQNIAQEVP
jgi:hypothetical protein